MEGRPTVITKNTVAKLVKAFKEGFTDQQACDYAQIHTATFYRHMKSDEAFAREIGSAKVFITITAAKVVVKAIKKGDIQVAKWWLEKKATGFLEDDRRIEAVGILNKKNYEY